MHFLLLKTSQPGSEIPTGAHIIEKELWSGLE